MLLSALQEHGARITPSAWVQATLPFSSGGLAIASCTRDAEETLRLSADIICSLESGDPQAVSESRKIRERRKKAITAAATKSLHANSPDDARVMRLDLARPNGTAWIQTIASADRGTLMTPDEAATALA